MKSEEEDSPLDYLFLSYSCPVDWSSMEGDERERLCLKCDKKVFNISALAKHEAEALLQNNDSDGNCYKFYLRSDGTIKIDNCPKVLRPVRERLKWLIQACSFLLTCIFSISSAKAQDRGARFGVGVGNPKGRIIQDFIKKAPQDTEDLQIQALSRKLAVTRTYTEQDYLVIERYFAKKGLIVNEFLTRQARVVNHNPIPGTSQEMHQRELEVERSKIIESLICDTKTSISENNFDFAILQINDCIKVALDPYKTLKDSGELPPKIQRWPFYFEKTVGKVIMSEKQKNTLIELLKKSKPSGSLSMKRKLLTGLGGAK